MQLKNETPNKDRKSYELFKEIISAITDNDENKIGEIAQKNKLIDYPEFPFLLDEKGNSIAHHLCARGNLNLAKPIIQGMEKRFRPSFYIENSDGKTPIEQVSNDNDRFKNVISRIFLSEQPNFSQNWILDQFRLYLQYKLMTEPNKYSAAYVNEISRLLESGHCFGFSSIWSQSCLHNNPNLFTNLFHDIVLWDRKIKTINKELELKFETVISIIRAHQELPIEIEESSKQTMILQSQGLFSTTLKDAKDFKYKQREQVDDKLNPGDKHEIVKNWGIEHYQCESNLMLYPENKTDIADYFEQFLIPQNNRKTLVIYGAEHYVACYLCDNKLYYYDSNDEHLPLDKFENKNQPIAKTIHLNQKNHLDEITQLINKSFFDKEKANEYSFDWGPTQYPINIRAMDLLGKKVGEYPTKDALESIWNERKKTNNRGPAVL